LSRGGLPLVTGSLRGIDTEGDEAIERFDELVAGALTVEFGVHRPFDTD
jgi:hypothetical protein